MMKTVKESDRVVRKDLSSVVLWFEITSRPVPIR